VAARLPLRPTRGSDLIEIAVKIELQQIGRIVGRLPDLGTSTRMTEAELREIECAHIALDRPNRVLRSNVILHPRRQKTSLLPANARLEWAIRHTPNRTSTVRSRAILAQPRKRNPSCSAQRIDGFRCALPILRSHLKRRSDSH